MDHRPELLDRLVAEFLGGNPPEDFDPAADATTAPRDLARTWVGAVRATMQEGADATAVDRLMALYGDDVVYERAATGIRHQGRVAVRQHLLDGVGSARAARVDLQALVVAGNDVVLTLAWILEVRDGEGWGSVRRKQSVVLHIVDGKIITVGDYW